MDGAVDGGGPVAWGAPEGALGSMTGVAGGAAWRLRPECGGSGTTGILLGLEASSKAFDALMTRRYPSCGVKEPDPAWEGLDDGSLGGQEVGHAHGTDGATFVVGTLLRLARDGVGGRTADEILADAMGAPKRMEVHVPGGRTVRIDGWRACKGRGYFRLMREDGAIDLDYQGRGSNSWYNLLRLTRMPVPTPPAGHPASAVADAYRPMDASNAVMAAVAAAVMRRVEAEGPPKRPRRTGAGRVPDAIANAVRTALAREGAGPDRTRIA